MGRPLGPLGAVPRVGLIRKLKCVKHLGVVKCRRENGSLSVRN